MQRKDGQNNQSITQARITVTEKLALLSKTNRPGSILISRNFFHLTIACCFSARKWTKPLLPSLSAQKYAVEKASDKEFNNNFAK